MADTQFDDVVAKGLVGDSWPVNHPGADPVLYGHVSLEPKGAFEARSLQTFKLVYTVGRYGIDDTGSIRVVFRFMGDWGALQSENPSDYNFVSTQTNTAARLLGQPWTLARYCFRIVLHNCQIRVCIECRC